MGKKHYKKKPKTWLLLFQNVSFNIKEYTSHYPFLSILSILGQFKEPREDYLWKSSGQFDQYSFFFNIAKMA